MKINILSEDKIITLATNPKEVVASMLSTQGNEWLKEWFGDTPFTMSKIDIDDCVLNAGGEETDKLDLDNAIVLYEHLKISESQAYDERLWYGLTFDVFYDYMQSRYPVKISSEYLKEKWFMLDDKKTNLFKQGISLLWWFTYLSVDESRENKYELTKFVLDNRELMLTILTKDFCNGSDTRLGLIEALRDYENCGGDINKKSVANGIIKFGLFLGGTTIIDIFSREEMYKKFFDKLNELEDEQRREAPTPTMEELV